MRQSFITITQHIPGKRLIGIRFFSVASGLIVAWIRGHEALKVRVKTLPPRR